MKKDTTIDKLHPKLRMIGNGSNPVNFRRAELSGSIATTFKPAKDGQLSLETAELIQKPDQLLGPGNELALSKRAPRKKRRKLAAEGRPTKAYADIFIEVQRSPQANGKSEAESLRDYLEKRLARDRDCKRFARPVLAKRNFVTATVPVTLLDELRGDDRVAFVQLAEGLNSRIPKPVWTTSGNAKPARRSVGNSAMHNGGSGIIIGIVDVGGFDFSHPDFTDSKGGTRFISIWDQGGKFRAPPKAFKRGAEFTKVHLDAAIKASRRQKLPTTAIERQSQQSEGSHGTHVASIAAGKTGVCPNAMIAAVLVDIPRQQDSVKERRGTFADSNVIIEAVEYLLEIAKRENKPISINISLGTNGGAHDGSSGVSRWLDASLAAEGRSICVAAGNAGQETGETEEDIGWVMGRIHAAGHIRSSGLAVDLDWTVVGNSIVDVSENELEIWYGPQDRFTVQVRPPGADHWIEVKPREFVQNRRLPSGTFLSIYNEMYHPVNGSNYIAIYLSPDMDESNPRGVQAGVWTVRLLGDEVRDGRFHCWIERDDPFEFDRVGHRRISRFPSFFSERSNVDSHSVSSLACGHRVIAVANLDSEKQKISKTSSQGPTRDDRLKPDIAAPGTNIRAANGFSSSGDHWVEMSGTSMASPYVAGVIGLMMSVNRSLTAAQCGGILQRTSRPLPGADYNWRNDAGFGAIEPEAAIREAKLFNQRIDIG